MTLSPLQAALMVGLTLGLAGLLLAGLHGALRRAGRADAGRATLRAGLALAGWLAFTGALAASGFLAADLDALPPRIGLVVGPALVAAVLLARSRALGRLLPHVPVAQPVGLQAFRIPVEGLLFWLYASGRAPVQMTFEGMNFDVVSGLLALPVAYGLARRQWPRSVGVTYNALGLLLLLTIVTIALLSAPGPLRTFTNEPANLLPFSFPMVWLPGFLVPLALFLHLVSLRQLLGTGRAAARRDALARS